MINVFGSKVGGAELLEVQSTIEAQWLGMGKKVAIFEKMMAEHTQTPFVAVDNCSNALLMALKILDLPPRSDVIVPTITWLSCANAVIMAGHNPVFADVDYDTVNMTRETVLKSATDNTKAVMSVHYAGYPCRTGYISIDIPIIADCAHAVDTKICGEHIANFADISVFSFDSMKNIAAGELGGFASPNPEYIEKAKEYRYCGILKSGLQASGDKTRWWEYDINMPFIKMLPNDICASVAIAQKKNLDSLQARRKAIWDIYNRDLADLSWLTLPLVVEDDIQHSYFTYFVKVAGGKRDKLARYLLDNGIYTTVRYQPLHMIPVYKSNAKLPVAERLNEELLNLPLHPNLTDKELDYVIDKIVSFRI